MRLPHRLTLYRLAVQHPLADIAFCERVYFHHNRNRPAPTRLRDDFAGGAAIAAAWVAMDDNHRALAVDIDRPTIRWAERHTRHELGHRAGDLHLVCADVLHVSSPKVDIIAALNFSTFTWHDREALRRYFTHARQSLRPGGVLVIDAYGGPGAMRVGVQKRRVAPPPHEQVKPFEYQWDQRRYDAVTARVDCRIHFRLSGGGGGGRLLRNAFHYDWRLWTLPELTEVMREAGFASAEVWFGEGVFRPVKTMQAREDWVAYVVGKK